MNDQHDGGGSCCMCDLCQEFRKQYLGIDADEIARAAQRANDKDWTIDDLFEAILESTRKSSIRMNRWLVDLTS